MATSRETVRYLAEKLAGEDVAFRPMMGEYLLYCRGKVVGGIYDERLLVKPVNAAKELLPKAPLALPYPGAKPMILVDINADGAFLLKLFQTISEQVPAPKRK